MDFMIPRVRESEEQPAHAIQNEDYNRLQIVWAEARTTSRQSVTSCTVVELKRIYFEIYTRLPRLYFTDFNHRMDKDHYI